MKTFELPRLDRYLMEKVITKLDSTSYFRMRRTCRDVNKLIRTSKNIRVDVPIGVKIVKNYPIKLLNRRNGKCVQHMDAFYGGRLCSIVLTDGEFDSLCAFLIKRRITCDHLDLMNSNFTKKECVTLLRILKPIEICMTSTNSNRYEAVLQSKTLKDVEIFDMKGTDIFPTLPTFLTKFEAVNMDGIDKSDVYKVLETTLRILRSQPPPKLSSLRLCVDGYDPTADWRKIGQKFGANLDTKRKLFWEFLINGLGWHVEIDRDGFAMIYGIQQYPDSSWCGNNDWDGDSDSSEDDSENSDDGSEISDEDYETSDDDSD